MELISTPCLPSTYNSSFELFRQFPHNITYKQQQQHHQISPNDYPHVKCSSTGGGIIYSRVYDIWENNFHDGMRIVRRLAKSSRYVSVDTEFPGIVAKVYGEYANSFEQAYHNIKVNIDVLKPIQIGFSFFDESGDFVDDMSTIQFNISWDVERETHAIHSIQLLENSGIDFDELKRNGIDLQSFAEAFLSSGLALNEDIVWIGFHSAYDFAYLMKICTNWIKMPDKYEDFHELLSLFFPNILDLKALVFNNDYTKRGLQELAEHLQVPRIGDQHQAGSDAMLTGETFFKFLSEYSNGTLEKSMLNLIYGLNYPKTNHTEMSSSMLGLPYNNSINNSMNEFSASPNVKEKLQKATLFSRTLSAEQSGRNSPSKLDGHKSE